MCLIAGWRDGAAQRDARERCIDAGCGVGGCAAPAGRAAVAGAAGRAVSAGPLAGRRIMVTRAARQSGGLRERLERQGAEVLLLPTIEIVPPDSYKPLDDALRQARDFDWLVVTSCECGAGDWRAADCSWTRSAVAGASALRGGRPCDGGCDARFGFRSRCCARAICWRGAGGCDSADRVRGQRVLLVRAAVARDVVPDALAAAGARGYGGRCVSHGCACGCCRAGAGDLRRGAVARCCRVTSGSTVTHLLDVLRDAGTRVSADSCLRVDWAGDFGGVARCGTCRCGGGE